MELQQQQMDLIQSWNEAKQQLKNWTEKESQLRDRIASELFDATFTEGTESISIGLDWQLKLTRKLNYNLSNKDGELTTILTTMPSVIAQNLVRWTPDLNLTMYRKVDEQTKSLLAPVLTIKTAKPTLELVPPK
jgi:hypothetical protein